MRVTLRPHLDVIAWALLVAIFALDLHYPAGYAVNLLYVLVILLGLWSPDPRLALQAAGVASGLIALGLFLSVRGADVTVEYFNRGVGAFVLWLTALGVVVQRRMVAARLAAEAEHRRTEARLRSQESLAQLGKMAAVVAHEVRNPLAGIRGALQVIGGRLPEGSRDRDISKEIVARIDTLNDIVSDLLQFARPRQPDVAPISLDTLLEEAIRLTQEDPAFRQVALRLDRGGIVALADPELLKLVLHNLLLNAAQAMSGVGEIAIRTRRDGRFAVVLVTDTGPGMPAEVRAHLFEPFFTTKHRGTGLGLATARRVIEAHEGTLDLECPEGGGTVAVVRLPAAP